MDKESSPYNLKRVKELFFQLGGAGSGHWGHASQPGKRGGSLPGATAMSIARGATGTMRQALRKNGVDTKGWQQDRLKSNPDGAIQIRSAPIGEKASVVKYFPQSGRWVVVDEAKGWGEYRRDLALSPAEAAKQVNSWQEYEGKWAETGTADRHFFDTGPGKYIVPGALRQSVREQIKDTFVEDQTPITHLRTVHSFISGPDGPDIKVDGKGRFYDKGRPSAPYYGFYKFADGNVYMSPQMAGHLGDNAVKPSSREFARATIYHEMGHGVFRSSPLLRPATRDTGQFSDMHATMKNWGDRKLASYGLRRYSQTDRAELFCDMYATWVRQPQYRPKLTQLAADHGIDFPSLMEGYK